VSNVVELQVFSANFLVVDIKDAIFIMAAAVDIVAGMASVHDNIPRLA
jgi:hypothetical protein